MMVFCCLLIAYEEERFYWPEHFDKPFQTVSPDEKFSSDNEEDETADKEHHSEIEKCLLPDKFLKFVDRFVTSIIFLVFSIFNLMMVMTTLYFHTPIEKVLGVALGVCGYNLISFKYPWQCFSVNQCSQSTKKCDNKSGFF
jgi:hypothetical protein